MFSDMLKYLVHPSLSFLQGKEAAGPGHAHRGMQEDCLSIGLLMDINDHKLKSLQQNLFSVQVLLSLPECSAFRFSSVTSVWMSIETCLW